MTKQIIFTLLVLCALVQFSFGQKTVSPSKQKLVAGMARSAEEIFPFELFEGGLQKVATTLTADFEDGISENSLRKDWRLKSL